MALAEREINNGTALTIHSQADMTERRPQGMPAPASYSELWALSKQMHESAMFGVKSAQQAMVVLMTGLELGFGPAQAMRGIHVINNKAVLSADMMVALCKNRPDVCRYFRLVESTDERATYETHRVGEPEPTSITFTADDAKRAALHTNPNHQKFPAQMKRARAAAGLTRAVYPDLILGLYTEDEIREIPAAPERQERDVTPERTQPRAAQTPAERTQPAPSQQASAGTQTPACTNCGKALTKAQQDLSVRNYGEALCPGCQRDHARTDQPARQEAPPAKAAPQMAAPEKNALLGRVIDRMAVLDDSTRTYWLDRFTQKWGQRNVNKLTESQLAEAEAALSFNTWPYEAEYVAAAESAPDKPEDSEPDPFAPAPPLMNVPAAAKGHGDS